MIENADASARGGHLLRLSVISRQSLGPQTLNRQMTISTLVFEALA